MKQLLLRAYDFFQKRRTLFYILTVLLFVLLGVIASRIKIEEDITRILPNGKQAEQINNLLKQSRYADKIIVKIKATGVVEPEQLIQIADSLEQVLLKDSSLINRIKIRVDEESTLDIYKAIHNNLPYYLEEADYKTIDSLIAPAVLAAKVEDNYNVLVSAQGMVIKKIIADDPVGITAIALKKLRSLQLDETYELYDGYMLSKDRMNLFLFITPKFSANETSRNEKLVNNLEAFANSVSVNGIELMYYGGPVVGVANARQLKSDTVLTLSITIVSLLLFTFFFFRKKRVPFVMMLPVAFGALFALTVISLIKGSVSSIAIGAGSIVLGIAINYSLHFFGHYKHCGSIKQTIADLLQPMTIGSFTTVASFFALTLLQSQVLNDFGLFAGLSLTGATFFALVFLPHFVAEDEKQQPDEIHQPNWLEKFLSIEIKHQGKIFIGIIALTFFFYQQAQKVSFDSDMNHFSFMNDKLKKSQAELDVMQDEKSKTVYIATVADSMNNALEQNENLLRAIDSAEQKGWVKKYSSINRFIPSHAMQVYKWKEWKTYWTDEKKQKLIALLKTEGAKYKFKPEAFDHFNEVLNQDFKWMSEEDVDVFKNTIGSQLIFDGKQKVVMNAVKVKKATRTEFYASLENTGAVILDKQIITNSFVEELYSDFNHILLYTALLVFFALLFTYGRLELTIITFLPMLITWIWILGIMGLLGLQFNLINIIISTFIFGLGDDFSIFTTDGLTQKFKEGKETIASHKVSIFLCAATTIIGLGALIFAKHPALKSIALISIIGIFCVVFIGQTVQPFLYNFFIQSRKERGLPPWTIPTLILFWIAFGYYVTVSLFASLVGYILLYLVPYPGVKKRKLFFHHVVSKALWVLTYMMVNVRKRHVGKENMDFSKPAIIIANHASFLDILVTVMQHPKLILLTNKWVYYSPVFGKVVQLADYYPVMEGVDPATQKFVDIVKDGYSIVIFPEGTRSPDGMLKRFHKGAFYLAEQLNIDIVPMLLHGTGDTIKKGDFMVMNAFMTMKFLPRISPTDKSFGEGYAERAKKISRYFKTEFEKLKEENERARYFRQRLRMNYIYKGPELELLALKQSRNEKFYDELNKSLPRKGTVTELGCGYGFTSYMLHFTGWKRNIIGIDSSDEKIDVANNCYSKNEQINFVCADVLNCELPKSDVFIINEKNLSLTEDELKLLLDNCNKYLNANGKIIHI